MKIIKIGTEVSLHNDKYSVLANPNNTSYQNCTEYTLDLINAAIYNTTDQQQLKANASAYFKAQPIQKSRIKLKLGALIQSDVRLDDHQGKIKTATFTTLGNYLREYGLTQSSYTLM